jgi:hypothetical protein
MPIRQSNKEAKVMTTATILKDRKTTAGVPVNARELMQQLNTDASKLNIWVRTELNNYRLASVGLSEWL